MDTVIERLCFEQACKHLAAGALVISATACGYRDSPETASQRFG